jgi:hypothetical protein
MISAEATHRWTASRGHDHARTAPDESPRTYKRGVWIGDALTGPNSGIPCRPHAVMPCPGRQTSPNDDQLRPWMPKDMPWSGQLHRPGSGRRRTSRPVRRILCATAFRPPAAVIHLGVPLPACSCGLPADLGEQPSSACASHRLAAAAFLGLAPGGVYQATPVARGAGGLLPHRFTLTGTRPAVSSLWHFPAGHPGLPLATTLLCGVRTFLGGVLGRTPTRPPGRLVRRETILLTSQGRAGSGPTSDRSCGAT